MKKVSIILPIDGGQSDILVVIKSLLVQDHKNWELLIIARDGFNYKKHLAQHRLDDERIHQHFVIGSEGYAYAYGLEKSEGDAIEMMSQNQRYYPSRLSKLLDLEHHICVDAFVVIEHGVVKEGFPLMVFDGEFLVSHYHLAEDKPSFLFSRSLVDYIGVDVLLFEDKEAFKLALLRKNDGGQVINELLHEIVK